MSAHAALNDRGGGRGLIVLAGGLALAASVGLCLGSGGPGDYQRLVGGMVSDNAGPATNALAAGRLHDFLALHPYMGSFSLLLRAPFVAGAQALGADDLLLYRIGSIACLIGLAALGAWVAHSMAARGQPLVTRLAVVILMVINPLSWDAIRLGHPEELLAAGLCVAGVLAARDRRVVAAGICLGLALVTKQWAIVAIAPVLLAAPARRWGAGLSALVVAAALTLPLAIGDSHRFMAIAHEASQTLRAPPTSVWAPFAVTQQKVYYAGAFFTTVTNWSIPPALGSLPRPLIVAATAGLALVYWRRRRDDEPSGRGGAQEEGGRGGAAGIDVAEGSDVLGLLALCLLVRGMLDPISPAYYYAPFVMALAVWEGLGRRGLPWLSIGSAATLGALFFGPPRLALLPDHRDLVTFLYLLWALPVTAFIAWRVYRLRPVPLAWPRARPSAPPGSA